jgi:glycosyltransferase involved in cell wall biosynthesis
MTKRPIVLGLLPPPMGGISVFVHHLHAHLQAEGVEFWAPGNPSAGVTRLGFKGWRLIPLLLGAKGRTILDSVERFIEFPALGTTLPWLALKRLVGFRWLKVVHNGALPEHFAAMPPWQRLLMRFAAQRVDGFVLVDPRLGPWLRDVLGVRCPVSVIGPLLPWTAEDASTELDPRYEHVLNHQRLVCATGLFNDPYGFRETADAVERLRRESGQDIGLVLIDGGFAGEEPYRAAIVADREWLHVVTDAPHAQVLRLMQRGHVFARPFRFESYGISRVEALWCGIPVVASKTGECRGMSCFAVGDQEAFVALLREALHRPDRDNVERWAATFRDQAAANLDAWRVLLGVGASR